MNESAGLSVRRFPGESPPLVALHGFTQTGEMYAELAGLLGREIVAPDLPGHGRSVGYPVSFAAAVRGVADVLAGVGAPLPLVGYSQGGRVALAVALERSELVSHLVLVSTTAGIEDETERAARHQADEMLAAQLRDGGLVSFIDSWLALPMFKGLERRGETWLSADRDARLENSAEELAAGLVGMGQGAQPFFGDRLGGLQMPVLVITGGLDQKYTSLGTAMTGSMASGTLHTVPDAGHAVIAEAPRAVADLIDTFLIEPAERA
jgi:2-succinyl-6-hydroxy-2,4-cyclohexadiene-1-carboxylate synthase